MDPRSFTYTSSNPTVATTTGSTISINGPGMTTITATQQETTDYNSATISATFQVNDSSLTNPVSIDNSNELSYFMNTASIYALINEPVTVQNSVNVFANKVVSIYNKFEIRDM